jgi:hypothetical protein
MRITGSRSSDKNLGSCNASMLITGGRSGAFLKRMPGWLARESKIQVRRSYGPGTTGAHTGLFGPALCQPACSPNRLSPREINQKSYQTWYEYIPSPNFRQSLTAPCSKAIQSF